MKNKIEKKFYENGNVFKEYEVNSKGEIDGYFKIFHKNGELKAIINSKYGKIHISCQTKGASLGYKIIEPDAVKPKAWSIYQKPFIVPQGSTILVQAHRIGFKPSEVINNTFVNGN